VHAINTKLAKTGGAREDASSLVAAEKVSITYPFQGIQSLFILSLLIIDERYLTDQLSPFLLPYFEVPLACAVKISVVFLAS
jgi:hypothetical protein